jgi:hypothetical protein
MSEIVNSRNEIPEAPLYVLANDEFMSGWGHAKGKTNVCVCPCETQEQAQKVRANLEARPEMKRVRTVCNKPRLTTWNHLYSLFSPEDAPAFYE